MGCDSHLYLQKKIKGEWIVIEPIDVGRDYHLFDILSNVRGNSFVPIAIPCLGKGVLVKRPELPENHDWAVPIEFGADAIERNNLDSEDQSSIYLGEHNYGTLTIDTLIDYKHWRDLNLTGEDDDDYHVAAQLGAILIAMLILAGKGSRANVRCIIGYDS